MGDADRTRAVVGTALVTLQFALILALGALAAPAFVRGNAPVGAWGLAAAGVLLALWAVSCNRPGNFNIRPEPRPGGRLVDHGPYRWIRHPMYTAVMACGAACAIAAGTVWGWIGVAALVPVLVAKAAIEERAMLPAHPGYREYRARTKRFVPGVI